MKRLTSGASVRDSLPWEQKKRSFFDKADMQSIACLQKTKLQQAGITLVALVVTIIALLILARCYCSTNNKEWRYTIKIRTSKRRNFNFKGERADCICMELTNFG